MGIAALQPANLFYFMKMPHLKTIPVLVLGMPLSVLRA
jgi:hypothetical protein